MSINTCYCPPSGVIVLRTSALASFNSVQAQGSGGSGVGLSLTNSAPRRADVDHVVGTAALGQIGWMRSSSIGLVVDQDTFGPSFNLTVYRHI